MRKHFVLDTNILLHDPDALFAFADNCVWIPIVVIEELDTFKKVGSELGRNAREVARHLDALRTLGQLTEGVPLDNGGELRVVMTECALPSGFQRDHQADDRILATSLYIMERHEGARVTLVTLDTNLRIRANVLGLDAEDYDTHRIQIEALYPTVTTIPVEDGSASVLVGSGSLPLPPSTGNGHSWFENEYVMVQDGRATALARVDVAGQSIEGIRGFKQPVWGIRPRNREQHFALDACLREDIHVVTLVGKAGTGKTLLALAAGLQAVAEEDKYQRLLVSRPIFPMGRDIGYLPGSVDQKLKPWMQPIHDNGSRRS